MTGNVTRFPKSKWERIKNRRGQSVANCIVSGRYLRFGRAADAGSEGVVVIIDVMTDTDCELPDRKICELIVPMIELRKVLERAEKEIGGDGA